MTPPLIPLLADCVWAGGATGISGLDGVAGAAAGVAAALGLLGLGAAAVGLDAAAVGLDEAAVGLSGAEGCWRTLKGEEMPAGAQRWLAVMTLCVPGSKGCHVWLHRGPAGAHRWPAMPWTRQALLQNNSREGFVSLNKPGLLASLTGGHAAGTHTGGPQECWEPWQAARPGHP